MWWVWWKFMKIVAGVVWPWRPDSWLQLREHFGICIQMLTAPLLTLKCSLSMENDQHPTTRDVSKDDAILWRISSLHTCHGSSDNINGSKLGSRSMVTAEAIFCVKLRKKLASHEWASTDCWGFVPYCCLCDMRWHVSWCRGWHVTYVTMSGCGQSGGLAGKSGTKLMAHGHWRPGVWPLSVHCMR